MDGFIWNFDPVAFRLGPFAVHYYGLLIGCVLVIGYYLWNWQMRKAGYDLDQVSTFPFYIGIFAVVGARLGHCFFYAPSYYLAHPITIIKVWEGGLSSHGAGIGFLLAIFLYSWIKKMPLLLILDSNSFVAALLATLVRIGNFLNSEIVGRVTDLPWCVHFIRFRDGGEYCRHPSQLYEAGFGLMIFIGLLLLERKLGKRRLPGLMSGVFMVAYFSCRFLVEFVKEYHVLPSTASLTMGQYLSIPFFFLGLYLIFFSLRHRREAAAPIAKHPQNRPSPSKTRRKKREKS
ncbi:MAG: prolipoprotein diacylglyceryl transferase [Thermodesulfobacteriota bacterium]